MILYYKNSILASAVSILGCLMAMVAIFGFEDFEIGEIVILAILALAGLIGGKKISVEKSFRTWWKQVINAGLHERLKTEPQLAQVIYSKNPIPRTIKEIAKYNPQAAEALRSANVK